MECDEGRFTIPLAKGLQVQVYEIVKCADPTAVIRICSGGRRNPTDGETAREVSGGVGRVRKRLLPSFDVGFLGVEFDASKEVYSRPWNP